MNDAQTNEIPTQENPGTAASREQLEPIARLTGVSKIYHQGDLQLHALRDCTLSFFPGDFVCISGPSGSGKSTLLHMLGALDTPTNGTCLVHGQDVATLNDEAKAQLRLHQIGFVFQAHNLLPVLTAAENIRFILELQNVSKKESDARVKTALSEVGLSGLGHRRPHELSGGQQQRVAIARALIGKPTLIIADEPTANLDSETSQQVISLLHELNEKRNTTVIYATHDPAIMAHSNRHLIVTDGVAVEQ